MADDEFDDEQGGDGFDAQDPLDEHETAMVRQDLLDLRDFESTFRPEGYRGMAVWCDDCGEEHYYPWDMLRENLRLLLETGEIPVHEPAFAPEPERYIQWEYARGYLDALRDLGVDQADELDHCVRCGLDLPATAGRHNFCPRCGMPLLVQRLAAAGASIGLSDAQVAALFQSLGLPRPPG